MKILNQRNISFKIIEYIKEGISKNQIKEITKLLRIQPQKLIRKNEEDFKKLNLDLNNNEEVIKAITTYPKILQRPIIIHSNKAVIGRPPENILDIL